MKVCFSWRSLHATSDYTATAVMHEVASHPPTPPPPPPSSHPLMGPRGPGIGRACASACRCPQGQGRWRSFCTG